MLKNTSGYNLIFLHNPVIGRGRQKGKQITKEALEMLFV